MNIDFILADIYLLFIIHEYPTLIMSTASAKVHSILRSCSNVSAPITSSILYHTCLKSF